MNGQDLRFLCLWTILVASIVSSAFGAEELTLKRVGAKDYGVNWTSPIELPNGSWVVGSDYGTMVVLDSNAERISAIDVGSIADLRGVVQSEQGLVCGDKKGVLRVSQDNGVSWKKVTDIRGEISSLQHVSGDSIVTCTVNGMVAVVNVVSGESTIVYDDDKESLTCMDYHGGQLTVFGRRGLVLHSTNIGKSWEKTQHDSTHDFSVCHRVNDSTLAVGAYLSQLFTTGDYGRTFNSRHQVKTYPTIRVVEGVDPVSCISHNQDRIFFSGTFTRIAGDVFENVYYSDNLGQTWKASPFPPVALRMPMVEPTVMFWTQDGTGVIALANNQHGVVRICITVDNGDSWQGDSLLLGRGAVVESDGVRDRLLTHQFLDIDSIDDQLILLSRRSLKGHSDDYATSILRSDNLGQDWRETARLGPNILSMAISGSIVALGCDSGSVRLSFDEGATYTAPVVVDSVMLGNHITVTGSTSNGLFVGHSNMRKVRDEDQKRGWVYTISEDLVVKEMPVSRVSVFDNLTQPFVQSDVVASIYHHTDEEQRVVSSYLVEWDVVRDIVRTTDITEQLRNNVEYGAVVKFSNNDYVWIAVERGLYRYNRNLGEGTFLNEVSDGRQYGDFGRTRNVSVTDDAIVSLMDYRVLASNSISGLWEELQRCGSTTNVNYVPTDILDLGNRRFFISGHPFNYMLEIPVSTAVDQDDIVEVDAPWKPLLVSPGSSVVLPFTNGTDVFCMNLAGKSIPVRSHQVSEGVEVSTLGLVPGMYIFTSAQRDAQRCFVVIVSP